MSNPQIAYNSAYPNVVFIDTGTGTAYPRQLGVLNFVFNTTNQCLEVRSTEENVPLVPFTNWANYRIGAVVSTAAPASFVALQNFVAQYGFLGSGSSSGGSNVTIVGPLGYQTGATAVSVAIATDQLPVATKSNQIIATASSITNSTSAYSAGMCVGGIITIPNTFLESANGTATFLDLILKDSSAQAAGMNIWIFAGNPTSGTYTDHATLTLNSADMLKCIRCISITGTTGYVTAGGQSVADVQAIGKTIVNTDGTKNLYAIMETTGTPTYTSTQALTLQIGVIQN